MKRSFSAIIGIILANLFLPGCAHREPPGSGTYSALPPPARTSDSSNDRVYATTITAPNGAKGTLIYGRPGAPENGDADIAQEIERTVIADPKLAPYPSKVTATMDPTVKGKVILTGMVPTRAVKKNLVEHVRSVSGVTEVEDNLVLGLPKSSRDADFR